MNSCCIIDNFDPILSSNLVQEADVFDINIGICTICKELRYAHKYNPFKVFDITNAEIIDALYKKGMPGLLITDPGKSYAGMYSVKVILKSYVEKYPTNRSYIFERLLRTVSNKKRSDRILDDCSMLLSSLRQSNLDFDFDHL